MALDHTVYKTYEPGSLGNVPQNKNRTEVN